jgi:hypothetical protein
MARRKRSIALVGVLWLVWIGLLVVVILLYSDTTLSHRANLPYLSRYRMGYPHTGFPYMPLYGAVTWWFFFAIPLIGWTWGYFNDLKSSGLDARYDRYRADGERNEHGDEQ